jgi:hypothetical protein
MATRVSTRQRPLLDFTTQSKPLASTMDSKKRKLSPSDDEDSDAPQQAFTSLLAKKRKVAVLVTPPRTPSPSLDIASTSFDDLIKLNTAFLSAMSLHHAHNGSSSSLDLRVVTPSITKAWGKRQVDLDDIRALIGIYNDGFFRLLNFGDGKVCIEMSPTSTSKNSTKRRHNEQAFGPRFEENELKKEFAKKFESKWQTWLKIQSTNQHIDFVTAFLRSVASQQPLEESSTVRKIAPLRAKGQQRLEEVLGPLMKRIHISDDNAPSDAPAKRQRRGSNTKPTRPSITRTHSGFPGRFGNDKENDIAQPVKKPETAPLPTSVRSASLIERIRAKESALANLPAGRSKAELERLAALQRAEELLGILNSLALSRGGMKVSFPLPSLVISVRSSIRNPMSKEDILRCVSVLQEIAPGHVGLVTFGAIMAVVVDRTRKPTAVLVRQRLREMGVDA